MKRIFIAAFALLASIALSAQQMPPMPVDQAVRIGHLDNGLTYYVRHNEEPKGQANFYIAQKVGSVLEEDDQRGLAHFLEHMCFNGTENFPGNNIITYCESVGIKFGADLNAYTSIDETVYNIDNVPVATFPTAVDSCLLILHDWAGALLLEGSEIDKERGVIHEEWRSRSGAQNRMLEKILPEVYGDNRYGHRMPIGTMEVVDNFPYEAIRNYYHKWYRPDQQGIVVVGDIDVDEVEQKIISLFSSLPAAGPDAAERVYFPIEDNTEPVVSLATDKEQPYALAYIMVKHDAVTPAEKNDLGYFLFQYAKQISQIILSQRLDEMTQVADPDFMDANIGDDDFFLSKTKGALTGIAVTDEKQFLRGVTSVYREMLRAVRHGFTESEYNRARADLLTRTESAYNQREKKKSRSYCQEYVRHFIDNEPIMGIENEYMLLQQLAPNLPVDLVNGFFAQLYTNDNYTLMGMLPEKEGLEYPSAEEIKAAIAAVIAEDIAPYEDKVSDKPLLSKVRKAGKVKSSTTDIYGYTRLVLSNGATVYVLPTDYNKDEILFSAYSKGGTSLYPVDPTLKVVSELMTIGGVGEFSATELTKQLSGKKVTLNPQITTATENINGRTTPKDIETLFQLNYLYFTAMRSDNEAFESWKTKQAAMLSNQEAQPMSSFSDTLTCIYAAPERHQGLKSYELESVDYAKAMTIAKERFANAADFTFIFTGAVNMDTLVPMIEKYIGSLPSKKNKHEENVEFALFKSGAIEKEWEKGMQTPMVTNLFLKYAPMEYTLKNILTFDILCETLSTELLEEIREKEGGTYGINAVGSTIARPEPIAVLQVVYQTDPNRYQYLNKRVEEILEAFAVNGPSEENLAKTKEYMVKDYNASLTENSFYTHNLFSYLLYGVDQTADYLDVLAGITAEDVKQALVTVLAYDADHKIVMVGVSE